MLLLEAHRRLVPESILRGEGGWRYGCGQDEGKDEDITVSQDEHEHEHEHETR
jgi:hypothetical protein